MGSVRLLLDTHAFIWRVAQPDRLSEEANRLIDNPANEVLVSSASAWEIATKSRLGKLPGGEAIAAGFAQTLDDVRADELPITSAHALLAGAFDVDHRDPFDRMLAAQASIEGAVLVTRDAAFGKFPISVRW